MENNKYTKEDYNNEPVHSCTHCKSLHIKILDNSDINYRDWETDRKSTRLNSSHSGEARMPSSA